MKYKVADLVFTMKPDPTTRAQAEKYLYCGDDVSQFEVTAPTYEKYALKERPFTFKDYQYLLCGRNFYLPLLEYRGIMLHSSAVVVDGKAYLFSAASGTGKSTHTTFWLEMFGEKAYIINDDKPAIRILDDGIYVYGTPWSGKHDISVNTRAKLQGICFLKRDKENWIKRMDTQNSVIRMYHGSLKNLTKEQLVKEFDIIEEIVSRVPIYEMGCKPDTHAAKMSFNEMSKAKID